MTNSSEISLEARLLLLVIIDKDGSVDDLHSLGYEYFQITRFLKEEINDKNAVIENGHLSLTEKGLKQKEELVKLLEIDKSDKFVLPQLSDKNEKIISRLDIFIPSEDELKF